MTTSNNQNGNPEYRLASLALPTTISSMSVGNRAAEAAANDLVSQIVAPGIAPCKMIGLWNGSIVFPDWEEESGHALFEFLTEFEVVIADNPRPGPFRPFARYPGGGKIMQIKQNWVQHLDDQIIVQGNTLNEMVEQSRSNNLLARTESKYGQQAHEATATVYDKVKDLLAEQAGQFMPVRSPNQKTFTLEQLAIVEVDLGWAEVYRGETGEALAIVAKKIFGLTEMVAKPNGNETQLTPGRYYPIDPRAQENDTPRKRGIAGLS